MSSLHENAGPADGGRSHPVDWSAELARHGRWLRTVVAARLGERQAAEEVVQEVALAAVRQQAPLADPAKVAPWLYRLAVRQALVYRRSAGRRRRLIEGAAPELAGHRDMDRADPLDWLLADEQRRMVRTALARLPRRDAEMLLLKYTEDWTYREISQRLGLSVSAVEARLHRARGRLRTALAQMNVIEVSP